LGAVLALVLKHQANRPFLNLFGISLALLHDLIFSNSEVSGKTGAVQVLKPKVSSPFVDRYILP
jgi:hypothetical protein